MSSRVAVELLLVELDDEVEGPCLMALMSLRSALTHAYASDLPPGHSHTVRRQTEQQSDDAEQAKDIESDEDGSGRTRGHEGLDIWRHCKSWSVSSGDV